MSERDFFIAALSHDNEVGHSDARKPYACYAEDHPFLPKVRYENYQTDAHIADSSANDVGNSFRVRRNPKLCRHPFRKKRGERTDDDESEGNKWGEILIYHLGSLHQRETI